MHRRTCRAAFALAGLGLLVLGQAQAQLLVETDKGAEEELAIEERREWFIRSRGLDEAPNANALRRQSVEQLQHTLRLRPPALLADEPRWQPMGPETMTMLGWPMGRVAGRVSALGVHPVDENTLYLGTAAGGVWKTLDGGSSWQSIFDQVGTLTIGAVVVDPTDPNRIWVGTGEHYSSCSGYFGQGLYFSSNGGLHFSARNGDGAHALGSSFINAVAVSPGDNRIVLAGGDGQCNETGTLSGAAIYRSTDEGAQWSKVADVPGKVRDLLFDPRNGQIVLAAVQRSGLHKSVDGGQTWTRLTQGLPAEADSSTVRLAISRSHPSTFYALVHKTNSNLVGLYRSNDSGETWLLANPDTCEGQCSYNLTLDIHPTNPDIVLIGTIRPALSTNGGTSFAILTQDWGNAQEVHQDTHVVRFSRTDGNRFWVGSDGGLWRSDNGGGSFLNRNGNLNITQYYDIAVDPTNGERMFGGAQDNSSSSRTASQVWDVTVVTGDGFQNAIDPADTSRVFQTSYPWGGPSIYRSSSSGGVGSFTRLANIGIQSDPFPWMTPLAIVPRTLFIAANGVYRADATQTSSSQFRWSKISGNLSGSTSTRQAIRVMTPARNDQVSPLPMYVGTETGRIWMSPDVLAAAPEWVEVTNNYPGGQVSDIAVDPIDAQRVFATRGGFGLNRLYRSVDGGANWQAVGAGLPNVPANAVAIDPTNLQHILVGTDIGVYDSIDGGTSFAPFMLGMPLGMVVQDLEISGPPYFVYAGTYSQGAWRAPLVVPAVGVTADAYAGSEDAVLTVSAEQGVLANDDGSGLQALLEAPPLHGSISLHSNGSFVYTPGTHFCGADHFRYRGIGPAGFGVGQVSLAIACVSDPPVANTDLMWAHPGLVTNTLANGENSLLANDTDLDLGDNLRLDTTPVIPPSRGILTLESDGKFTYRFTQSGDDSFRYRVCDSSNLCAEADVSVRMNHAPTNACLIPPQWLTEQDTVTINLAPFFRDVDEGQPLRYADSGLPAGLRLGASDGKITGTVGTGAATTSPYDIRFWAIDPSGAFATQVVRFTVLARSDLLFRNGFDAVTAPVCSPIP
ncbi:Ig-like domain-containing protein [Tahibacter amnicola]|uniref:Ig-like domain-containing protein n=1 Tax=Tahibacter amnicola TaxID=2976241 RepID=A0ABY6BIH7_9GAMM|nr:Ig-like domain-containing protein [Tahibacter amnicola]UXI69391.1 Ig-like domain-containing protein [Tahibacter amnicola]